MEDKQEKKHQVSIATPDQGIATDIVLNMMLRHRDSIRQAHTGEVPGVPPYELSIMERRFSSVDALMLLVSTQREMVVYTRPFLKSKDNDDYKELQEMLSFLKQCIKNLRMATWTKTIEDDFIVEKQNPNTADKEYYLTENFYDMLEDLEDSYEVIFDIMFRNGLINKTFEESERRKKSNEIY